MSFEVLFFSLFAGGWLSGRLLDYFRLPPVLGMTLWGVALAVFLPWLHPGDSLWPAGFWDVVPFIKSLALVVILLRAGLGISRGDLRAAGISALLMAFVPCVLEGAALTGLMMYFFDFPWQVAGLTGFMLAAVSPAVVVPSMLDLKSRGLGQRHGVITVILAGASVDDVFAITFFTLFLNLSLSSTAQGSALGSLLHIPVSIVGGLVLGLLLGLALAWWFKKRHQAIRATEKSLLLLASAMFLVQVGEWTHLAALLGVMACGFMLLEKAEPQAHELAGKLAKVWVIAQIALFVIIGMSIDIGVALKAGPKTVVLLLLGLLARSVGVWLATIPSEMTYRERLFCVIAYLPKATVQAALGGVALSAGLPQGQTILAIAVLAIVLTAPLGLIGINLSHPYLLRFHSRKALP